MRSIFWFRQDLRLTDNPGLYEAARLGDVLPIYMVCVAQQKEWALGSASRLYLHESLKILNQSLHGHLHFYKGDPETILLNLVKTYHIRHVFLNRCYEPCQVAQDDAIERMLREHGVSCLMGEGSYLWQTENILNNQGSYFKVFSAYKRKVMLLDSKKPVQKPDHLRFMKDTIYAQSLQDLELVSHHPWEEKVKKYWEFGENAAINQLERFLNQDLQGYSTQRNNLSVPHTSKLSPHLHFGTLSPRQILDRLQHRFDLPKEDIDSFLNELIWREFSCYCIRHMQRMDTDPVKSAFYGFPWKKRNHESFLNAWKQGQTGYPIVDAGMRELWETGYMHNRARMIVASFLVKNLMIHWHEGRDWFWNCLVDANLPNNSINWQWVAGCGIDAAPYFRIFNPMIQGETFDPQGFYTKKWIPELKFLPNRYLFKPWIAPAHVLESADVVLGITYPYPIVDWTASRQEAMKAFKEMR